MTKETFWYERLWTKEAQNSAYEREINIYAIVMHQFLTDPFIMNKKQTTAPHSALLIRLSYKHLSLNSLIILKMSPSSLSLKFNVTKEIEN